MLGATMVIGAYVEDPELFSLEREMDSLRSSDDTSHRPSPVLQRQPAARALDLFPTDRKVELEFDMGTRMRPLAEALETEIPESIRGEFIPWMPILTIGTHDIIEETWAEPGLRLVCRAAASFEIRGQPTPLDTAEYERRVLKSAALRAFKKELEVVLGSLDSWVGWWV